jgi:hypothetical protein
MVRRPARRASLWLHKHRPEATLDTITRLAQHSVLRASGFSGIAILMVMMGTAHDVSLSLRFGAGGFFVLSLAMATYARLYHVRGRIEETEVWIMLPEAERPQKPLARILIVNAMREQLAQKALWWLAVALGLWTTSVLLAMLRG